MQLIGLAEEEITHGLAADLFPSLGATLMWLNVLYLVIPAILIIGGICYLWRLLRAVERIAEGLNKQR